MIFEISSRACLPGFALLLVGCSNTERTVEGSADSASIRSVLRQEVGRSIVRDTTYLRKNGYEGFQIIEDSSKVIPGLVYHWGHYKDPKIDHSAPFDAVLAARAGRTRVIRSASDRALAAVGWTPRNEADVIAACEELIHTGREDAGFLDQPLVWTSRAVFDELGTFAYVDSAKKRADDGGDSEEPPALLELDPKPYEQALVMDTVRSWATRLHHPMAEKRGTQWMATLWTIAYGVVAKYECTFDLRNRDLKVRLKPLEVINLPGF